MTHSEKNNNISSQDFVNDNNQMILLIENKSDFWLGDILMEYDVKVVFDLHDINVDHKHLVKLVTPKLVRDVLRYKKLCIDCIKGTSSSFNRKEIIFQLLRFVLKDKAYDDLTGVPLVPILNDSHAAFGDKKYYLTKQSERKLFPKYGPNVFIDDITDQDVREIFLREDFQKANNIGLLNLYDFSKILKHELPKQPSLDWNPKSSSTPNRYWLNAIWDHILDFDCNLYLFEKYPLLPINKPAHPGIVSEQLVALTSSNPLIRHPLNFNHEPMVLILEKLGVHFTDFRKSEQLKPYIFDWNPQNVLRIVEILRKSKDTPMEKFLDLLDLNDRESFRRFIIDNWFEFIYAHAQGRGKVKNEFYNIIRLLPIWPTHSRDKTYMSPKNGCLLPQGLVFYSPQKIDSNYFDIESENEWLILNKLGVPVIRFNSYLTSVFYHINSVNPSDPDYMKFICSLLSLPLSMIPESLEHFNFIPNENYTKLMKAKELYDPCEELFREVFVGSDQFLPPELRSGWVLDGLIRLGLNCATDSESFIRVAEEIENLSRMPTPPENLRERAKVVVHYFYYHAIELNLSSEAWEKLSKIKFVPSKPVTPPFLETAYSKVPELYDFNSLCPPKYRNICWTQCPIYDDDVLPNSSIYSLFPEMNEIETQIVINHLYAIIRNIVRDDLSEWKNTKMIELLRTVLFQIYKHLNEVPYKELKSYLKIKLKVDPKIFLNGEDPFNPYNWVSGKQLILNIDEDINSGNRAVCAHLTKYKRLLRICGAEEMKSPCVNIQIPDEYSQRDKIAESFARFLDEKSNLVNKRLQQGHERSGIQNFHDIFFNVHGETIGSNRYVLAASANYFEKMFTAGTMESNPSKPVYVNIDDIKPESFRIMLKWLYGRRLDDALSEIKIPQTTDEISFYLEIYIDLLNACEKYDLQELKRLIEHKIVKSDLIRAQNVLEVKKWAEKYNAMQLFSYCKDYKKENLTLLIRHRCADLLDLDEDELSEEFDDYEDEFDNLESCEEEIWDCKIDTEFEKYSGW
ncbi:hypothetical protein RclHR1_07260002 [Rhizophagus clarus]|uniref:BTB/POZ protein n=1 Tax=Rhizophagus clarus TaxID=94130 RepID=A0A2Z6RXY2_9GLOM|nr:hypothetical protein RclHR1_07260002 [Rhizophagus clarus]GES93311.1 BTB/POZ protein [Rhizophagus clarus]